MYTLVRDVVAEHHECLSCQQQINQAEDIFVIRRYELLQTARTLFGDDQLESEGIEAILGDHYDDIPEALGSKYFEVVGFCENCAIEVMSKFISGWKPPREYGKIRFGVDFTK